MHQPVIHALAADADAAKILGSHIDGVALRERDLVNVCGEREIKGARVDKWCCSGHQREVLFEVLNQRVNVWREVAVRRARVQCSVSYIRVRQEELTSESAELALRLSSSSEYRFS